MTASVRSSSILTRASFSAERSGPSMIQSQVDRLVSGFVEEAASPRTLAAIMVGGLAYRMGRVGVMSAWGGQTQGLPRRFLSIVVGLGSEVTAFEFTNRTLHTIAGGHIGSPLYSLSPVTGHPSPHLWSWSGPGGWREGLATSAITFGMLRSTGFLVREQNIVLQHVFQSTSMVTGHQVAGLAGLAPRPEGSLAEQVLHAEVTNLQLGAGMGLVHAVAPGINAMERGLDLSLSSVGANPRVRPQWVMGRHMGLPLQPVTEGSPSFHLPTVEGGRGRPERDPNAVFMVGSGEGGGARSAHRPIFQDPIRAFQDLPLLTEYKIGERYLIAREGKNQLTAEFKEGPMQLWGPSLKMDYFLNGEFIGWNTFGLDPLARVFRSGKMEIELRFRNQGLGKMILLHDHHQIHRLGFSFVHMAINPIMIHALQRRTDTGEAISSPDTMIQYQVQNFDPWEPEMVNIGEAQALEKFHAEDLIISQNSAYQITGRPNPKFFEALEAARQESSPRRISRVLRSSQGIEYPFTLLFPDRNEFLQIPQGTEVPIAEREGRTILLKLRTRGKAEYMDAFVRDGTPEWDVELIEGNSRGQMLLWFAPDAISRYEINTKSSLWEKGDPLPPGAGSIVTEWLATQAAIHNLSFNIFAIKNPQIVEILSRRSLLDLEATQVDVCYWNDYWHRLVGREKVTDFRDPESLKEILRKNPPAGIEHHFLNIKGRPHPDLIPPHLRPPRL